MYMNRTPNQAQFRSRPRLRLATAKSARGGWQYSSVSVTSSRHINIMDLHQHNKGCRIFSLTRAWHVPFWTRPTSGSKYCFFKWECQWIGQRERPKKRVSQPVMYTSTINRDQPQYHYFPMMSRLKIYIYRPAVFTILPPTTFIESRPLILLKRKNPSVFTRRRHTFASLQDGQTWP